jgi:hypothetical protein
VERNNFSKRDMRRVSAAMRAVDAEWLAALAARPQSNF